MQKLETTLQAQVVLERAVTIFNAYAQGGHLIGFEACLLKALFQEDLISAEKATEVFVSGTGEK